MIDKTKQRQKELLEAYKKTPKQMGAYCIRNDKNGRCFVACSRDITARFNRHRMELKMQVERSSAALQADWLSFGVEAFSFELLEELVPLDDVGYDPADDLAELESLWIDKLNSRTPDGYN